MNESMVERVAKAMWERTHDGVWGREGDDTTELYRADARTAIAAMRHPTDVMIENEGIDRITLRCARAIHSSELPCADIWRTMIDGALGVYVKVD